MTKKKGAKRRKKEAPEAPEELIRIHACNAAGFLVVALEKPPSTTVLELKQAIAEKADGPTFKCWRELRLKLGEEGGEMAEEQSLSLIHI